MINFLRREDVERITGLARSTIYVEMQKSGFPKPVRITGRAVGWVESEILAWQKAKIAERDRGQAA